jgi:hypothetical protein
VPDAREWLGEMNFILIMNNFKELSFEEKVEVDGGFLPLIVLAGKGIGLACGLLAGDIILNFSTYSAKLDAKLANC